MLPKILDGLTVKIRPDGNISILIHHDDLLKALSKVTKAPNGCTHAVAQKLNSPTKGYTHFEPRITTVRDEV